MGSKLVVLVLIILVAGRSFADLGHDLHHHTSGMMISRRNFPKDFVFGAASSAYQYEGAAYEDGKGASIWDTFTEQHPEKIANRSNANVTVDFYHHYKDDIKSMKEMGLDSFRFSISWSRILPRGKIDSGINELGIKFYNDLINELLANGIKPSATLFHWDVPQALEDEYGGFLSPRIVNDFRDYANLVFNEFGDRVKHWSTLNEPNIFIGFGYASGTHAPGRCSKYIGNCMAGNSATEPYVVSHNLLLSHGAVVELFRSKYQASQKGIIGISIEANMVIPINQTRASRLAALRGIDFNIGGFLDPIIHGNYPKSMRLIAGKRLPKFTKEQSKLLKQSFDFIGLNYYSTSYVVAESVSSKATNLSYSTDSHTTQTPSRNGVLIGKPTAMDGQYSYPKGIQILLRYIKAKYNNPAVFITENGMADPNNGSLLDDPKSLDDTVRVEFYRNHLRYLLKAIKEGANVKGFYAWTWVDDFEWNSGYTMRFGLNFVDFKNGLKRYKKQSFYWFKKFLAN